MSQPSNNNANGRQRPGRVFNRGFQNLSASDLRTFFEDMIHSVTDEEPVMKLNLVGNKTLGDDGMEYLHLLPDTIIDLDLSDCNIGPRGAKLITNFMETNTKIERLIMWGNHFRDEGGIHIADMLKVNTTIKDLCIWNNKIGLIGYEALGEALKTNTGLSRLELTNFDERIGDEHLKLLCNGIAMNRGLKTLNMYNCLVTEVGLQYLLNVLPNNYYLEHFGISQVPTCFAEDGDTIITLPPIPTGQDTIWSKVCYYFEFNKLLNRKLLLCKHDTTIQQIQDAIIKLAQDDHSLSLDVIYIFIRNHIMNNLDIMYILVRDRLPDILFQDAF